MKKSDFTYFVIFAICGALYIYFAEYTTRPIVFDLIGSFLIILSLLRFRKIRKIVHSFLDEKLRDL